MQTASRQLGLQATRFSVAFTLVLTVGLTLAALPARADLLYGLINTGEIFASADNGVTWSIRSTTPVRDAVALQARTSSNDLFMASASGSIYHSTDAGTTWSAVGAPPVSDLVDMTIRGDGDIVILTASGDVYRSADFGASFAPLATLTASNFTSLASRSDGRLFALTRTGEVYLSADGGGSWVAKGVVTTSEAIRIRADGTALHVMTSTGDDFRSTDSGATWTVVGTLSQVGTAGLAINAGTLVAATREGHVASSADGATWTWRGSMNQLTLTALAVDTPAVSGVIEPATPTLQVGVPWPNPARGGTSMSLDFTLSGPEVVTVRCLDAAGRLVAERPATAYGAGSHTVVWDSGLRDSGVYFLRVETARGVIAARRWVVAR